MAYPTTAALVTASSAPELTSLTAAEQDALRAVAIAGVERFTGQKFESRGPGDVLVVDGTGGRELYLPKRVEAITGVIVRGTSIDLSDVALDPDGARLYFRVASTHYAVVAMRETAIDSRTFRTGAGTVVITGTFGWTVTPVPVVQAIRLEMEEQASADASQLSGIVSSYRRLGLRDISQGNLRATIGQPGEIGGRAARLLQPYVWTGAGGFLV